MKRDEYFNDLSIVDNQRKPREGLSCPSPLPFPLFPYQIKYGLHYLRRRSGCGALFWSMRLRKTRVAIRYLRQQPDARRVLVIGPYSVLPGWKQQLTEDRVPFIAVYEIDPSDRLHFLITRNSAVGFFLLNKECFLQTNFISVPWDAIVLDESTFIANPLSKISKYYLSIARYFRYRIILTGTPAPESPLQYFNQLQFIDPKILNYKNYWHFRAERTRAEGYERVMPLRDRLWLMGRIARECSVLDRKDVSLEKEKRFDIRYIILSDRTRKRYNAIEKTAMDGKEILKFAGQRWNELRRLCSGEEKFTELLYLLSTELRNEPLLIYAQYIEEIQRIAERIKSPFIYGGVLQKRREEIRKAFQSGTVNRVVIQPETVKFGQDFSRAGVVIFFSRPCGALTNSQVLERTENLFDPKITLYIDLMAKDTVEEDLITALTLKESNTQALDRVRRGIWRRQNYE